MSPSPQTPVGDVSVIDGVDVDAVAAAVRACPSVVDLGQGPIGQVIATYLPGRQIPGIRVDDRALTVQVRGRWDTPVIELAAQVRLALHALARGRQVDIIVSDLTEPSTDQRTDDQRAEVLGTPAGRPEKDPASPIEAGPAVSTPAGDARGAAAEAAPAAPLVQRTVIVQETVLVEEGGAGERDLQEPPPWMSASEGSGTGERLSEPTTPTGEGTPPCSSPG